MVRSSASALAATFTGAAAEIRVAVALADAGAVVLVDDAAVEGLPAVAGPVCAERFACGGRTGAFGEKNRVHSRITPIESRDAASKRISWPNLGLSSLTCGPHDWRPQSGKRPARALPMTMLPNLSLIHI